MNLSVPPGLRLFHRGDLDGFFALGLDNMLMLILMSNFCLGFPLYMPRELFFERILPAAALGLVIGNLYYARQAWRLAQQEGRSDVCALPFGINIITLIAFGLAQNYIYEKTNGPSQFSEGEQTTEQADFIPAPIQATTRRENM